MVKTYQLSRAGRFGSSLKIAPITTETELNANTCLQVNGTFDMKIQPQSVLPSLEGFQCVGSETIDGRETEKWQLTTAFGDKKNKYTLWMRYMEDPRNEGIKAAVPVRYEMKGYNSLLGSHYDHYYLEYDSFNVDKISDEIFKVTTGKNISLDHN